MVKEQCKCCQNEKPTAGVGSTGFGYNRLDGEPREWAKGNQFARSEYCVPVKGGNRFGGPSWVKIKCGDGRMGFSTRRKGQDEGRMEVGLDGQFKKRRGSLVRRKSSRATATRRPRRIDGSRCSLVSSVILQDAARDPVMVAQQERVCRKTKRARNRNGRARRNHQRLRKISIL